MTMERMHNHADEHHEPRAAKEAGTDPVCRIAARGDSPRRVSHVGGMPCRGVPGPAGFDFMHALIGFVAGSLKASTMQGCTCEL